MIMQLKSEEEISELTDACDRFCKYIHHIMGAKVTIGIGQVCGHIAKIAASYQSASDCAKRVPSIITLFISAALAGMFALIFQPHLLLEISGLPVGNIQSNFKGLLMTFYGSTSIKTGNPELNSLVATRGMSGMMNTIWLILCAMCFGGAMAASGMLGSITSVFLRFMKRTVGLVTSTVASGLFLNICTADQYISIILTGNMFKDIYEKKGYESRLLSRTVAIRN